MSLLFLANKHSGFRLSVERIEKLHSDFIELGFISESCYVKDADGILNYLGVKCKYTNKHESPKYETKHNQIEILCLQYPDYKHFVVGDGFGNISYNPMGVTANGAYKHSKRIFKLL